MDKNMRPLMLVVRVIWLRMFSGVSPRHVRRGRLPVLVLFAALLFQTVLVAEQDNLQRAFFLIGQGELVGFMSRSGELMTPPRFDYAEPYFDAGYMMWCEERDDNQIRGYFANRAGAVINTTPVNDLMEHDFMMPTPSFTAPDGFAIVSTITNDAAYVYMGSDGRIGSRADPHRYHPRVRYGIIGDKVRLESPSGVLLIDVLYDDALWAQGCIPVRIGQKWGFVDEQARPVWPLEFDGIERSWKGYCWIIRQGGLCGAMDEEGRFLVPVRFEELGAYEHGMLAAKENGKWGAVGKKGRRILAAAYDDIRFANADSVWCRRNGKWGLYSRKGNKLLPHAYDEILFKGGSSVWCRKEGKWGLYSSRGVELLPHAYNAVELWTSYDDVSKWDDTFGELWKVTGEGGVGLVDGTGMCHAPCRFEAVIPFVHGKAFARKNGKWGLVGLDGVFLIEPCFTQVETSPGRPALVAESKEIRAWPSSPRVVTRWGVVTDDGIVAATTTFTKVRCLDSPRHDLVVLWIEKKCGLVNVRKLTTLLPIQYDEIEKWIGDLYAVRRGQTVGLVTATGAWRLPLTDKVRSLPSSNKVYEWDIVRAKKEGRDLPSSLRNNHGPVKAESGTGLIRDDGRILLPCRYEDVGIFSEGLVPVKQKGRWGYMTLEGKRVVPPRYEEAGAFLNGFAAVRQDGKVGLIDRRGRIRVPFRYADAGYVREGRFPVAVEQDGKRLWGIADLQGNTILPHEYDCVEWDDLTPGKTRFHGKRGWSEI